MADVRVVTGRRSRTGELGMTVSTFGMNKLIDGVDGRALEGLTKEAMEIARADAFENWAFLTGASRDSIRVETVEVGSKVARVALMAGGHPLITDSRNESKMDYAPYLEFNGSPSGSMQPGVMLRAVIGNDRAIRDHIHAGVKALVEDLLA